MLEVTGSLFRSTFFLLQSNLWGNSAFALGKDGSWLNEFKLWADKSLAQLKDILIVKM